MMQKTYKRELATLGMIVYLTMWVYGIWSEGAAEQAEAIKTYVFTFAGLAFGMDAYAKQVQ